MKKFRFQLETYLKLKELEEKEKLGELAVIVGRVDSERQQVQNYFNESHRYMIDESREMRAGNFNIKFTRVLQNYFYVLEKRRKVAERNISELQTELKEKQGAVAEAHKNRRVIEILREKKMAEYEYLVKKEETRELDEFNAASRVRKQQAVVFLKNRRHNKWK